MALMCEVAAEDTLINCLLIYYSYRSLF